MKVCIIDDMASNLSTLKKFLKLKGHETVTTNSGKEGLSILENEIFDAVILDLHLPEFSGFDIVNALHESGRIKDQKIIAFTAAFVDEEKINDLKEKGVRDFLEKPLDLEKLLTKLEEITKS